MEGWSMMLDCVAERSLFVRSSEGSKWTGVWKRLLKNDVALSSCSQDLFPDVRHQALLEVRDVFAAAQSHEP